MACSYCLPCHRLHNHSACCTHWLIHLLILIYSNLFTFAFVAHALLLNSKLIFSCHLEFSLMFFWVSQCKTIFKKWNEDWSYIFKRDVTFLRKNLADRITVIQERGQAELRLNTLERRLILFLPMYFSGSRGTLSISFKISFCGERQKPVHTHLVWICMYILSVGALSYFYTVLQWFQNTLTFSNHFFLENL